MFWGVECAKRSAHRRRSKISFDTNEAVTITLIGIGTAFFLLAFLSLLTALLPRIAGLLSGPDSGESSEEESAEERNKALAATIAVSVAMSRGHGPGEGAVSVDSPPSLRQAQDRLQSSTVKGEEV